MPTNIRARLALCLTASALILPVMLLAQRPAPDRIPATGGDIIIAPINHATLQIRHQTHVIDVDPVAAAGSFEGLAAPTIILITDIHGDHMDPATVAKLKAATTLVVAPRAVADKLDKAIVMANGETKTIGGLTIEAMPMYNLTRGPAAGQLFHDKGRGNGYVITMGGKRIYIAGDTEGIPEMRALKNIDVAFIPMNLPYTMTPAEAADAVKAFKPKIVYPYHYRGTSGMSNLDEFSAPLKGTGIEVRIRDWYAK
ncbi:MAG TPA: MBL fold metallo-hydrolase [Vicinamibacterales bacterium]|nr:MBL fold metallo-hydrolase [Vicinamibacterales bacterium]